LKESLNLQPSFIIEQRIHFHRFLYNMLISRINIILCLALIMLSNSLAAGTTTSKPLLPNSYVLIGEANSKENHFKVQLTTQNNETLQINQFQQWIVEIKDLTGNAIYPARIGISGGMPAHGHGLPTQPQVTDYLGNGRYLIEGIKLNMDGNWIIQFRIVTPTLQDTATISIDVNY
jgi:hypothetical protein